MLLQEERMGIRVSEPGLMRFGARIVKDGYERREDGRVAFARPRILGLSDPDADERRASY